MVDLPALDRGTVINRLRARGSVLAEEEADLLLAAFAGHELDEAVFLRMTGTPLEHLLGWVEFAGLRLAVAPGVFVPRQRTQLLFEVAMSRLPRHGTLVELCCGVAPVATAIATARSDVDVHASDIDPEAVSCARENLSSLRGKTYVGDLISGLPEGLAGDVDVVVANAPYVPTEELALMPREAREHEPLAALDGGPRGTSMQAAVAHASRTLLKPGGLLIIETGRVQSAETSGVLQDCGYATETVVDSELMATCVVGRRDQR